MEQLTSFSRINMIKSIICVVEEHSTMSKLIKELSHNNIITYGNDTIGGKHHYDDFMKDNESDCDVLIIEQNTDFFFHRLSTKLNILFVNNPYELKNMDYVLGVIDCFICDSSHKNFIMDEYSINIDKILNIDNIDDEIDKIFINRSNTNKDKCLYKLMYNSDIVAAYKLSNDIKYREMLDFAEQCNLNDSTCPDFSAFAEVPHPRALQLKKVVGDLIKSNPNQKINILDIGCNNGTLSIPLLLDYVNNINTLTLYDSSEQAISLNKEWYKDYPQVKYIVDDARNLLKHNLTPDVVIIGEILEHIEDYEQFLYFLMNLRTENTTYFFTVPNGSLSLLPWHKIEMIHHVHHFELSDIKHIFKNVNVNIARYYNPNGVTRRYEPADNWMFWFTVSKTDNVLFNKINYEEKLQKVRPFKSLSTCIITNNNSDTLSLCLQSINAISDEIIIIDNGSTDNTKDIAKQFTDNIFDGNDLMLGLSKCTSDYILLLSPTAILYNPLLIFKNIESDYYDVIMMPITNIVGQPVGDTIGIIKNNNLLIPNNDGLHLNSNCKVFKYCNSNFILLK